MYINQFYGDVPVERTFNCRHCGVKVVVTDPKDKRCVYCSQQCEKQYWREITKQRAAYAKRSREKVLGLRNYSARDMAIKLWREKKESEETQE